MVVSAKATDAFGYSWEGSEELSGETLEKVTKSRSSKTNSHVVPLDCCDL